MSIVEQIKNAMELYIGTLIPTFSKSQNIWDSSLNSDSKTRTYYAVRPQSAAYVQGTCKTIMVEQEFAIEIGDNFRNKKDSDADADAKVYAIYEAHETIYKEIFRDNFGIPRVQVVSNFSMGTPEIDNDNKSVKIESIFTVRYRME